MPVQIVTNGAIALALARMRDRSLPSRQFRFQALGLMQRLLAGSCQDLHSHENVIAIMILRAALAAQDAVLTAVNPKKICHIGLKRHEHPGEGVTIEQYYSNVTIDSEVEYLIVDPMWATGFSAAHVVQTLVDRGIPPEQIRLVAAIGAPEAEAHFNAQPWGSKVRVFLAVMDERLDDNYYIVPGLGDFGDRFFGT